MLNLTKPFEEFVSLWKSETKDIKIKNPDLLFLVVYPDKLEWDFGIEKQTQTTTLMVSGGFTGASIGHDVQFCYRSEVNDFLKDCSHTHAMIVSVGMVFDMVGYLSYDDDSSYARRSDAAVKRSRTRLNKSSAQIESEDTSNSDYSKWYAAKQITPRRENRISPITDFYDFVDSEEYCKGHIMARPDVPAYLHYQHINLNVAMWKTIGCPSLDESWEEYERGVENHHDDYTPYWIKPKDRPMIINFSRAERTRKSFSYYKPWHNDAWKDLENVDRKEFYFSRFMTRIQESFYMFNTETFKKIPAGTEKFNLLFSPTAGYSAEEMVNKLEFSGEVIFYDYTQINIDVKRTIVDMNMSLEELYNYKTHLNENFVDNNTNKPAKEFFTIGPDHPAVAISLNNLADQQYRDIQCEPRKHPYCHFSGRTTGRGRTQHAYDVGTHEDLRAMQEKMRDEQEINYWLMNIITPDYNKLSEKVRGKNVFFDTSNIFSYHMSHARFTLEELVNSYNKLHQVLIESANMCWFQGTKPTKQNVRTWIS